MKINLEKPKIIELSNLYSFISNLSQWNEAVCVPRRKKEWLRKTGELTVDEKKYLKEFCLIFQEAEFNLEPIFLFKNKKNIWPSVVEIIGKEKTERIKLIFAIFEHRFRKLWPAEKKKLRNLAEKFIQNKPSLHRNLETIIKLCGLSEHSQFIQKIKTKLFISAKNDCQGWSFNNNIALECSGWSSKKINYLINNIFLHECFHILIKKNERKFSIFKTIIEKNKDIINGTKLETWTSPIVFEEALVSSFLPEGYLGGKNTQEDIKKVARRELKSEKNDKLTKLRYFCALNLYELSKEYIDNQKSLDVFYFKNVSKCVQGFISDAKYK